MPLFYFIFRFNLLNILKIMCMWSGTGVMFVNAGAVSHVGSPGTTATNECEPPDLVLRTELSPLKERYALLTTEPFL